jgi:hypothetical protein
MDRQIDGPTDGQGVDSRPGRRREGDARDLQRVDLLGDEAGAW